MTSRYLILYALFLPVLKVVGQSNNHGVYTNKRHDFVCIDSNEISVKLYNNDALASFGIGKADIVHQESSFYIKEWVPIIQHTSTLDKEIRQDDGVSLRIKNYNGSPIEYAQLEIKNKESGIPYLKGISDKDGVFFIDSVQIEKLKNVAVIISVKALELRTEKQTMIESGVNYTIKSEVPYPFTLMNKKSKIKFKVMENNKLLVEYRGAKTILEWKEGNANCSFFPRLLWKSLP